MYQIKLFYDFNFPQIEEDVNKWIKDQGESFFIISITPSVIPFEGHVSNYMVVITIVYEE